MVHRPLRIATAGLYHETNTFAPGMTRLDAFQSEWVSGLDAYIGRYEGTRTSMGGVIAASAAQGAILLPGLYAAATPSSLIEAGTAETLLNAVVESVDPTADGLLLILHGAMVSGPFHDMEGELLHRLRSRLGRSFPIAMTLDLHGNISRTMAERSDIIVGYDTYPHVDMFERAEEAFRLLTGMIGKTIRPVQAYGHTGMLLAPQGMMTEQGGMKKLIEQAFKLEKDRGVLSITVAGGFPYGDVPDAGMSVVALADGDQELAERCVSRMIEFAVAHREEFAVPGMEAEAAIAAALSEPEGPVILCEGSDNVGGGAPADATHVLKHLLGISQPSLIVIYDPEAVGAAFETGISGTFSASVGGKSDPNGGAPVPVRGKVRLLSDGDYRHAGPYMTGQKAEMGRTAVVECGMLTLVLTEKRTAPWDIGHVRSIGLWPADYRIIVVKSAIAWQAAFGAFAKRAIQIDSPGCCSANLKHFHYRNVRRPAYPLDPEPKPRYEFGEAGR